MNQLSRKTFFNLLLKREGDSFELGKYYFSSLSPDEKEEMKRLLNQASQHYFYKIVEAKIEREEFR
jgi:hypothetical protein